jgi:two-component system sensor histidine kinase KdpD
MISDEPRRPDPDALLADAKRQGRGRLRVYLGMAPGVGKTYEMLTAGERRKTEGVDVVVGVVETHGRKDTEALTAGLEVLPRKPIEYRGRQLMEFDIDGALARKPGLLLVDEYAHTNAPGSRHPKRWQDVEELLEAGMDVWTTLNVQHLESLVDVVWKITGVRVRETVPDSALSAAAEIEVVDITPDELRKRLDAGKVYLPETARTAAVNFFKPENLTALREMALRRAAQTVDDQMVDVMRRQGAEAGRAARRRQRGADRRRPARCGARLRRPQQRHPDRGRQVARQPLAGADRPLAGQCAVAALGWRGPALRHGRRA